MIKITSIRLKTKVKGFNGVTHLLIGIFLFLTVYAIPIVNIKIIEDYMSHLTSNFYVVLISFLIVTGGSLFPDLDSSRSTAEFRLGNTGKLISSFMRFSGLIVWKLYHLGRDKSPNYMHRALYHTPLLLVVAGLIFYNNIPRGRGSFLDDFMNLNVKELPVFFIDNFIVLFVVFLAYLFIRLSIGTMSYRPFKKVFKKQYISDMVAFILSLPLTFYIISMSYSDIRMVSMTIILGYSTHLIGDLFTRGSIPLFYPFPIKREAYFRPNFPLQISTNEGPSKITNNLLIIFIVFLVIYNVYKLGAG